VLPLWATLERMDWRLVDAATDLGSTPAAAFRQVTLRLTAPGLITGALLVFIPMMGEYIIPIVLGGGRIDFIGNVIQRSFLEQQDYAFGSALALLVMAALSFFLVLYLYLSTRTEQEYGA
jgi:spermidine/putrescine transport system permease protein